MKVVIIGGAAGGATAAARIRRLDEAAEIVMFERSGYISYANCGMPYYIGGVISEKSKLTLQTPKSFAARYAVDVRVRHEVVAIDTENKLVSVKNLDNDELFETNYDKLLIATGAKPIAVDGAENCPNAFYLRTLEDALRIREFVETASPKTAIVVGGGAVGIEMAENLRSLGLAVTLVEGAAQVLPAFDRDMASFIHAALRSGGIELKLNSPLEAVKPCGDKVSAILSDGSSLEADLAILSLGTRPDTVLATLADLALGVKGSIVVDEHMRTSAPDVFAVGDAVQISVGGEAGVVALAGPANRQARIAADSICGVETRYSGAQATAIVKLFGATAAVTGMSERTLRRRGVKFEKAILSPASHAGYYPGGKPMTMKVLFGENGELYGAQIFGSGGVDKRIDVLATAIRAGMRADELTELELAYAPPYSSAKDPVNVAGYIAENVLRGAVKQWYYEDIEAIKLDPDALILDTRTPMEFAAGHIDGALNIPVDELRERMGELPSGKRIYVICRSGQRSYISARQLMQRGFDAYNFAGGMIWYEAVKGDE